MSNSLDLTALFNNLNSLLTQAVQASSFQARVEEAPKADAQEEPKEAPKAEFQAESILGGFKKMEQDLRKNLESVFKKGASKAEAASMDSLMSMFKKMLESVVPGKDLEQGLKKVLDTFIKKGLEPLEAASSDNILDILKKSIVDAFHGDNNIVHGLKDVEVMLMEARKWVQTIEAPESDIATRILAVAVAIVYIFGLLIFLALEIPNLLWTFPSSLASNINRKMREGGDINTVIAIVILLAVVVIAAVLSVADWFFITAAGLIAIIVCLVVCVIVAVVYAIYYPFTWIGLGKNDPISKLLIAILTPIGTLLRAIVDLFISIVNFTVQSIDNLLASAAGQDPAPAPPATPATPTTPEPVS